MLQYRDEDVKTQSNKPKINFVLMWYVWTIQRRQSDVTYCERTCGRN